MGEEQFVQFVGFVEFIELDNRIRDYGIWVTQ